MAQIGSAVRHHEWCHIHEQAVHFALLVGAQSAAIDIIRKAASSRGKFDFGLGGDAAGISFWEQAVAEQKGILAAIVAVCLRHIALRTSQGRAPDIPLHELEGDVGDVVDRVWTANEADYCSLLFKLTIAARHSDFFKLSDEADDEAG